MLLLDAAFATKPLYRHLFVQLEVYLGFSQLLIQRQYNREKS